MLTYPNIFTSQSKEFSQDGFIDWLLRCAYPSNTDDGTRNVGQAFIRFLIGKHNELVKALDAAGTNTHGLTMVDPNIPINEVLSVRQHLRIDVLGRINGEGGLYIIFENKLGTEIHGQQPTKYREDLTKDVTMKYPNSPVQIIGVYYKVLEERDYAVVRDTYHYCTLSRQEMRKFLSGHIESNPIIHMYHDYLDALDKQIHQWKSLMIAEMNNGNHARWAFWSGWLSELYQELKERLKDDNEAHVGWGWVNNVSGGFHGLWLGNWSDDLPTVYLQCHEHELKVRMSGRRSGGAMHDAWSQLSDKVAKDQIVVKAKRMQNNAQSAEIGNLGSYIKPDQDGKPSIPRTADYLVQVFGNLKEVTKSARSRSDIPPKKQESVAV